MPTPASPATRGCRARVATFDFDGTLSACVSGARFFQHKLGRRRYVWLHLCNLHLAAVYALRLGHQRSLARITDIAFRGRDAAAVRQVAERFALELLRRHLLPASTARLREHVQLGDRDAGPALSTGTPDSVAAESSGDKALAIRNLCPSDKPMNYGKLYDYVVAETYDRDELGLLAGPRALGVAELEAAGFEIQARETFRRALTFHAFDEALQWGLPSGFFAHVVDALGMEKIRSLAELTRGMFRFHDEYVGVAVLATPRA